jgi:hypothetical protein
MTRADLGDVFVYIFVVIIIDTVTKCGAVARTSTAVLRGSRVQTLARL